MARPQTMQTLPSDYGTLCRSLWLPRPIRDKADHAAALAAIEPLWGHEADLNPDQADWFELVADLIVHYEAGTEKKSKPLPVTKRLAGLLEAHAMKAADLGRLLGLEPSMGSNLVNGTRQLTTAHIRKLARHFALPANYFLEASLDAAELLGKHADVVRLLRKGQSIRNAAKIAGKGVITVQRIKAALMATTIAVAMVCGLLAGCVAPRQYHMPKHLHDRLQFESDTIEDRIPLPTNPTMTDYALTIGPFEFDRSAITEFSTSDSQKWQLSGDGAQHSLTLIAEGDCRFRYFIGPYYDGHPRYRGDSNKNRYTLQEYELTRRNNGWTVHSGRRRSSANSEKLWALVEKRRQSVAEEESGRR